MSSTLSKSIEILERTPDVLGTMLRNVSPDWTSKNEGGEDSWDNLVTAWSVVLCQREEEFRIMNFEL